AYNRATTRNGDKISIALRQGNDCIVSPSYRIFRSKDENELNSEYLMMWFRRPEFDRYARFKSHGSAHEFFEYDQMCQVELPIPSIDKQREIVKEYNVIQNRIILNQQLIQKLEETAQTIYKQWFVEGIDKENLPDGWTIKKLSDFCDIKGGKRLPKGNELNDEKNGNPYIKVADMTKDKFIVLNDSFQFVSNDIQKSISRYIVQSGDIIISIVGTIGLVNIVDSTLLNANLTENCYRLTNFKVVHSDYLYYYLVSPFGKKEIESRTVGGVQAKLPMYNVQSLPVVLPKKEVLQKFEKSLNPINDLQNTLTKEIHKLTELKDLLLSKLATIEN
ncbi:MAG: restriction endonuclease subunit S, partial [Cyclobacteriaceae bacterium]